MDRLLLIDDEVDVQYSFRRIFDSSSIEIFTANSGEEGLKLISKAQPDLVIVDIRLGGMNGLETLRRIRHVAPKVPVIMMTAYGTTQTAIEAMKLGAYDYLLKPFDVPRLKEVVFHALKAARDMKQVVSCQPLLDADDYSASIIGRTDAMQGVFKTIGQLATTNATVLITGESGTGKELVARAIYHHSQRSQQAYLAINCAAIPENLLESELFGHEKGAFTGASTQRIGKFEQCHHGTIFLDEVGDMSLSTQTRILRVLQSGQFERLGGNQTLQVDVRILAATNKPLEEAVAARQFREDLFYRLNVVRLHLPPLRERRADIPLLVDYFLNKYSRQQKLPAKSIAREAIDVLEACPWPGNVRELENVVHRALVMAKGDVILLQDLPPEISQSRRTPISAPELLPHTMPQAVPTMPASPAAPLDLETLTRVLFDWARQDNQLKIIPAVERLLVIHALKATKGNQLKAAQLLGITRATLRKRIAKFKIRSDIVVE